MNREVRRHNETVLETLEEGDMVEFPRGIISHWGLYGGDETIVHLAGVDVAGTAVDSLLSNVPTSGSGMDKACVKRDNFWDVAGNSRVIKNNNKDGISPPFHGREIMKRALSSLGPTPYSVPRNNCEHFAASCRNGVPVSFQVDIAWTVVGVVVIVVVVGWLAYKLFTYRKELTRGIRNCCSLISNGIRGFFGYFISQ